MPPLPGMPDWQQARERSTARPAWLAGHPRTSSPCTWSAAVLLAPAIGKHGKLGVTTAFLLVIGYNKIESTDRKRIIQPSGIARGKHLHAQM